MIRYTFAFLFFLHIPRCRACRCCMTFSTTAATLRSRRTAGSGRSVMSAGRTAGTRSAATGWTAPAGRTAGTPTPSAAPSTGSAPPAGPFTSPVHKVKLCSLGPPCYDLPEQVRCGTRRCAIATGRTGWTAAAGRPVTTARRDVPSLETE